MDDYEVSSYDTQRVWWIQGYAYKEIAYAAFDYRIPADIVEDIQNVEYYDNGYCYSNLSS